MGIHLVIIFLAFFLILGLSIKEYKGTVRIVTLASIAVLTILFGLFAFH